MLLIADVSRGEDDPKTPVTIDFQKMKAGGVVACYFRATNGKAPDATLPIFRKNCEGVLPWGVFGVLRPLSEGVTTKVQAEAFIDTVGDNPGLMPIGFDWEVEGATWQQADEYLAILEAAYPKQEIIDYSRVEYLRRMLPNRILQNAKYNRFAKLAVWQAQYGVTAPSDLPAGFTRVLWQFTDRADASKFGIIEAKQLDMSYFDGTLEQFQARFRLSPAPAQTIPPTPPNATGNGTISGITLTLNYPDGHTETITRP